MVPVILADIAAHESTLHLPYASKHAISEYKS